MTFSQAAKLWNMHANPRRGVHSIMLTRNTYLQKRDDNTFAIRLYEDDIVLIHRDGTFTLNTGGHHTVLTFRRIERYSPATAIGANAAKKNPPVVFRNLSGTHTYTLEDGMRVNHGGYPTTLAIEYV